MADEDLHIETSLLPATPASMSAEDLRLAYAPGLIHVILSLAVPGQPHIRAFTVENGAARQIELTILEAANPDQIKGEALCI